MIYVLITLAFAPLLRRLAPRRAAPPHRVLVIQLAKIGDLLCSTPVFRELRRTNPEVVVEVLCGAASAPLLRFNPHVGKVHVAAASQFKGVAGKWALIRMLRAGRYDALICLNMGVAYPVCALWARVPMRLGLLPTASGTSYRLATRLWTHCVVHRGDLLIQETYLALLRHVGVAAGSLAKDVFAGPSAEERGALVLQGRTGLLIGLGVSSANKLKELGTDKLAATAKAIAASIPGAGVVLIGGPEDRAQATAIVAMIGDGSRVTDTTGQLALDELSALLQRLAAYVGVDSGITYMADALGVPVVSVAGPCNMAETRPLGRHVIILQKPLPCAPCAHIFDAPYACRTGTLACTQGIAASEIVAAVRQVLEQSHDKLG